MMAACCRFALVAIVVLAIIRDSEPQGFQLGRFRFHFPSRDQAQQGPGGTNGNHRLDYLDPEDFRQNGRPKRLCDTKDGLRGVCHTRDRCASDRFRLSNGVTFCNRRKICCPSRKQQSGVEVISPGNGQTSSAENQQILSTTSTTTQRTTHKPQTTTTTTTTSTMTTTTTVTTTITTTSPTTTTTTTASTTTTATTTTAATTTATSTTATTTTATSTTAATTKPTAPPVRDCGIPTPIMVKPSWLRNGRRRRSAQGDFVPFIIGGVDAEVGKWPWIALIGMRDSLNAPFWFCGGTLIDERHVLTAAHCLKQGTFDIGRLIIRLGEYDTQDATETPHHDFTVEQIINHPGFKYPKLHDDISLVRLSRRVQFTNTIKPICLPATRSGDYSGSRVDIAGWGYTEFGGTASSVLQEVNLPIVGIGECQSKYEAAPSFQRQFPNGFGNTKLCAAEQEGGKDACQGDSGGPMMRRNGDQRYELLGVVSAGVGCGSPGFPGVYTRVSAYIDWINAERAI